MQEKNLIVTFLSQHKTKIEIFLLLILISILLSIISDLTADKQADYKMTICSKCKFKEVRFLNPAKIQNYKCKKCSSPIGIAWKCMDCHYEFPVIEKTPPPTLDKSDYAAFYLEQTRCPNCGSTNTIPMLIKGQPKPKPQIFSTPNSK